MLAGRAHGPIASGYCSVEQLESPGPLSLDLRCSWFTDRVETVCRMIIMAAVDHGYCRSQLELICSTSADEITWVSRSPLQLIVVVFRFL